MAREGEVELRVCTPRRTQNRQSKADCTSFNIPPCDNIILEGNLPLSFSCIITVHTKKYSIFLIVKYTSDRPTLGLEEERNIMEETNYKMIDICKLILELHPNTAQAIGDNNLQQTLIDSFMLGYLFQSKQKNASDLKESLDLVNSLEDFNIQTLSQKTALYDSVLGSGRSISDQEFILNEAIQM